LAILGLLGIVAWVAGDKVIKETGRSVRMRNMTAQGAFMPLDFKQNSRFRQNVIEDWHSEQRLYQKEYIPYLRLNKNALRKYQGCLVSKLEVDAGLRPLSSNSPYNKNSFDPFIGFHMCYDENIRIFNETGEFYV